MQDGSTVAKDAFENAFFQVEYLYSIGIIFQCQVCLGQIVEGGQVVPLDG